MKINNLVKLLEQSDPSQYSIPNEFTDVELLNAVRQDIMAEYDAINLYEAHLAASNNEELNAILRHIIDEEKEHVKELEAFLNKRDF